MASNAPMRFALNHMAAPQLRVRDFFALARRLELYEVEIRNDIEGEAILDGTPASAIRGMANEAGVVILTINALQRFNDWTTERAREAAELIGYARDCGARALILVPTNDGRHGSDAERAKNLRTALAALLPMLKDNGVAGLVEPLGFASCSLRSKREAAEAISDVGGAGALRITHDTFHHHLAGEPELFAQLTGLVHISGVADRKVGVDGMRDAHRVLVDRSDRLGNIEQIRALLAAGYSGPFSFEPFAAELRTLADPAQAIGQSIKFIEAELAAKAA
jgi:2-keto-myo-inositol isomerase